MSTMSRDTLERLRDCVDVYKRTDNLDVLREIRDIFSNHSDDPNARDLTSGIRL